MGKKRVRLNEQLIRKYFGRRANISSRWFGDGYNVITETGGEILISDKNFQVVIPTEDVLRSMTLLGHELWGGLKVHGSREYIMAWMAHGEACGVSVRPAIKRGRFWRTVVLFFGFVGLMGAANHDINGVRMLLVAALLWWLMERSAKKAEQVLTAQLSYHFPRVHGMAGAAHDDDLERENWV